MLDCMIFYVVVPQESSLAKVVSDILKDLFSFCHQITTLSKLSNFACTLLYNMICFAALTTQYRRYLKLALRKHLDNGVLELEDRRYKLGPEYQEEEDELKPEEPTRKNPKRKSTRSKTISDNLHQ